MTNEDLRQMHRDALTAATAYVDHIAASDLERPTPCAPWDLRALLAHEIGQHHGFAAAVRDGDAPESAYAPIEFTPNAWRQSVDELVAAFATADLDALVTEVELRPTPMPVSFLLAAQLLDITVHTWDIARSVGQPFAPRADIADAVGRITELVPSDGRGEPGSAFAPTRPATGTPWEQTLAALGRDPQWTP